MVSIDMPQAIWCWDIVHSPMNSGYHKNLFLKKYFFKENGHGSTNLSPSGITFISKSVLYQYNMRRWSTGTLYWCTVLHMMYRNSSTNRVNICEECRWVRWYSLRLAQRGIHIVKLSKGETVLETVGWVGNGSLTEKLVFSTLLDKIIWTTQITECHTALMQVVSKCVLYNYSLL